MKNEELIEKLENEQAELKCRIDKLLVFLNKQKEERTISEYHLNLLVHQYEYMYGYMKTLNQRIKDLNWERERGL